MPKRRGDLSHLATRRTRLVPPGLPFVEELYELAATGAIPWQWRSIERTPDRFRESFWSGVLAQFAIEDRRTGRNVGLIRAHDGSLLHGFASITMVLLPEYRMRVWPLEAALSFAGYVFKQFNLRNLYAETSSQEYAQFRSGAGTFFEVEGHLKDRVIVDGCVSDIYVLRFSRDVWLNEGVRLLARVAS